MERMRLASICAAFAASMLLLSSAAESAVRKEIRGGVHGAVARIWFSETIGRPVVSFPLGCTTNCDFSIWVERVQAGDDPQFTDLFHRPDDPDDPFLNLDACYAWTRVNSALRPTRSGIEHFFPGNPEPSDDSMFGGGGRHPARRTGPGLAQLGITNESTIIVGKKFQYLEISRWSLLVSEHDCRFTFRACYFFDQSIFDEQAKRCPLSE